MKHSHKHDAVDTLLHEHRIFHPSEEFKSKARINDHTNFEEAQKDPEGFWESCAEQLDWFQKWDEVLEWRPPFAKWFIGGKLNASYNCLDRHIKKGLGKKTALIWQGEDGAERIISYQEAYVEVQKFANVLKSLGVKKGDRVAIYLPLIPEACYAMLACARIGAVHSVVFGGFSVDSLRDRIQDASAKVLITADSGYRRGKIVPLKETADKAVAECPSIEKMLLIRRTGHVVWAMPGRDVWYHEAVKSVSAECPAEAMDAEDLLYILYTSGTTGKPKGIMHTTGGYMTGVTNTFQWVFDYRPEDVYWCTADVGWVTGHSYVVYGPMANAATQVIFEGVPDYPDKDRFWRIIEKYKVTIFYTAPTAIRAFMKWGTEFVKRCDVSSLRLLGSVGEPINPEAWIWYHENIGQKKCPIVDTWWQTETGAIMISPLPGLTATKPGSATKPLPGVDAVVVDEEGKTIKEGGGFLAIKSPWPSMLRGIYGDAERYTKTYWNKFPDDMIYFPGDGCKKDEDGYLWLLGRVDDIMLVAGHNISTMEVESALVDHHSVAESAVVGINDELTGQAIAAFVIVKEGVKSGDDLDRQLKAHVAHKIGAIARPKKIIFTPDLPKTRSGKIMRRLLRDIAEGRALGDITTLADPTVLQNLKAQYEEV